MTITAGAIVLRELRFHAFHGVLPQERRVGNDYTVSVRAATDLSRAAGSDRLEDTLNYAALYDVVHREMGVPSQLLEHVAGRIGRAVLQDFPQVTEVDVSVAKVNPPMGANGAAAGVELHLINDKTEG